MPFFLFDFLYIPEPLFFLAYLKILAKTSSLIYWQSLGGIFSGPKKTQGLFGTTSMPSYIYGGILSGLPEGLGWLRTYSSTGSNTPSFE